MYTLSTFYNSKEFRNLVEILKLERVEDHKLICPICNKEIIKKYDCIAHHVIELTEANVNDFNISLNPENIKLIHFKCHNKQHNRFGYEVPKKVYCVYGPPCSGKSTWVAENATSEDLIVDIDSIWQMISINERYIKPNRLKQNVFMIRDVIMDMIKTRTGRWRNAFIIGGYPFKGDRERLQSIYGCEFIFIDTDRKTCLERARNDEWVKYIEKWFSDFEEDTTP